jgi:FRG domain
MPDPIEITAWPEIRIESWDQFNAEVLEKHLSVTPSLGQGYIYRGQEDASWTLKPSLTRRCHDLTLDRTRAVDVETRVLRRFQARAHRHFPNHLIPKRGLVAWWTLMQHYSTPTRILDWTYSPLVALYFAVHTGWEKDGAMWLAHGGLLVRNSNQKYGEIQDEDLACDDTEDQLFRSENPPPRIILLDSNLLTERMVAQQGTFTICQDLLADHADAMKEIPPASEPREPGTEAVHRRKLIIPKALKRGLLKRLHLMNISPDALFPGIDGLGREIEERIRLV